MVVEVLSLHIVAVEEAGAFVGELDIVTIVSLPIVLNSSHIYLQILQILQTLHPASLSL